MTAKPFANNTGNVLSRRALLHGVARMGLVTSAVASRGPRPALAQEGTPGVPIDSPGFRLVARIPAEEWAALATATATPTGETLAGPALLAALRAGGFVIYIRHARTDFSQGDTDLSDLSRCAAQRNLSTEGRAQARLLGETITALAIPIGDVLSSELCRTRETAELAFGRVTPMPDLTSFGTADSEAEERRRIAALQRLLSTPPAPGSNTFIVGHLFNIQGAANVSLPEGGAAIFLPARTDEARATPTARTTD